MDEGSFYSGTRQKARDGEKTGSCRASGLDAAQADTGHARTGYRGADESGSVVLGRREGLCS